ncbi:MAG: hypothetical protein LAP61_03090 [Acidobacteriia bacterium]|nr:hypothetical protein [Terriglobia bacterium]
MERFDNASLIVALIEKLRENQSWAGETHLQKAAYVLKRTLGVPIEFAFILYKHGPFSFDLRDEIGWMRSMRLLEWEVKSDFYGPSLRPGQLSQTLKTQFSTMPETYSRHIQFVAERFGGKNVAALERLATAIYVTIDENTPAQDRARYIHELKPHVSIPEADAALIEADALIQAANAQFPRV